MKWFRNVLLTAVASLGLLLTASGAVQAQTWAPRPASRTRVARSRIISLKKVRHLFKVMAAQPDIAFRFPRDGCYARAHLMVQRLRRLGVSASKVWAFPSKGERLYARTANDPRGHVEWKYHVAPYVVVRYPSGRLYNIVLDPSLFDRPVAVDTWAQAQKRSPRSRAPFLCKTRPGQAPYSPEGQKPGTGYWPSKDPRRGKDYHARRVMQLFKPYEGRSAPKGVTDLATKL